MPLTTFSGVKLTGWLIGFAGAFVSLRFAGKLTKMQSVVTVLIGGVSAGFITPAVSSFFEIPPISATHDMLAFFTGFASMNILTGIFKLSEMFKNDPMKMIKYFTRRK